MLAAEVPHEVAVKMLAGGHSHLQACVELEQPLPSWLSHMDGKLVPAIGKRPQVLDPWSFSVGFQASRLAAGFPRSELSKGGRWNLQWFLCLNTRSHTSFLSQPFGDPDQPHTV